MTEAAPTPLSETNRLATVFPNVPHEDQKDARDRSYQELSSSAGHSDTSKQAGSAAGASRTPSASRATVLPRPSSDSHVPPQASDGHADAGSEPDAASASHRPKASAPPACEQPTTFNVNYDVSEVKAVPEVLHESLRGLGAEDYDTVLAFFNQGASTPTLSVIRHCTTALVFMHAFWASPLLLRIENDRKWIYWYTRDRPHNRIQEG